jgi:CSLREA domain-containing protein
VFRWQRSATFLSGAIVALVLAPSAGAVGLTVNDLGDTNDQNVGNGVCADVSSNCTLRAAIQEANALAGEDIIDFSVTGDIDVGSELIAAGPVQIHGPGADDLTVRRAPGALSEYRVMTVQSTPVSSATLSGFKISNGVACQGGGIAASGPLVLTLIEMTIQGNAARCFSAQGGGIWSGKALRVIDSTIQGNVAQGQQIAGFPDGGGGAGGGIFAQYEGSLIMRGSTVVGNSTAGANGKSGEGGPGGNGGGSAGGGIFAGSEVNIESSTITDNGALNPGVGGGGTPSGIPGQGLGGGVIVAAGRGDFKGVTFSGNGATHSGASIYVGNGGNAEAHLKSTIVANSGSFLCGLGPGAEMDSFGFNIVTDNSCPGNVAGSDPQLQPLANNGGPTETMAIPKSSPAVDAGFRSASLQSLLGGTVTNDFTDQRGLPRPLDFPDEPNGSGDGSDVGAFELQQALPDKSLTITAKPKKVQKNDKTTLTAKVGPCPLAQGELVTFERKKGDQFGQLGSLPLPAAGSKCKVELTTKVKKKSVYRAVSPESAQLSDATSNTITVEVK